MSDSRPPTPETLEVKRRGRHRLIGAVTLAVLAVVAIPMLLDSEPRKVSKELALNIPSKDGQPALPAPDAKAVIKSVDVPAPVQSAAPAAQTAADPAAASAPAAVSATPVKPSAEKSEQKVPAKVEVAKAVPAAVSEKPAKAEKSEKADKADKAKSKTAEKASEKSAERTPEKVADKAADKAADKTKAMEGFVIQLGAFSDAEKLAALKAKMKSAKITVFTEDVQTGTGKLTRLRAGPYKTREQADKALATIKKAGAEGKVVPLS
jgi:DedD protein